MTVLKIEANQVFFRLSNGLETWVPKSMLKQFKIKVSSLKVGDHFPA